MMTLELQYISPKLLAVRDLSLAVPGTYKATQETTTISSFVTTLHVMSSKQRPRRCGIHGSDGREYRYLLKGHEDLRQDERVMQLFGLVNTLLAEDADTASQHLRIKRYEVIPLAPNSGLLSWVPNCDTLHALIKNYREEHNILINIELQLMQQVAPGKSPAQYDALTLMQKVGVFEYALDNTTGQDLYKVLWLKSRNSEAWLERRTNYTRSLAVMSMVGYILGLGDRHPSNLMLDRVTGAILHIDFGDCFEVAMTRDKYPEKVPFRLTRMLTNAMEVSGIEGNYRVTCEAVMRVLREHHDALMAVLEAFVYDPLINWRITQNTQIEDAIDTQTPLDPDLPAPSISTVRKVIMDERNIEEGGGATETNSRAVEIITRIQNKLSGRDFGVGGSGAAPAGGAGSSDAGGAAGAEPLSVSDQVDRLISMATSNELLCQSYLGWCPYW